MIRVQVVVHFQSFPGLGGQYALCVFRTVIWI